MNHTSRSLSIVAVLALLILLPRTHAAEVKDYSKGDVPGAFKTFTDENGRFTVSHPADWTAKTDEQGVGLFAPDNSSNLKVQVVEAGAATLKDIVEQSKKGLQGSLKNVKWLSEGPAAFGTLEAHHWVFRTDVGDVNVQIAQLLFKKGARLYIISYGSVPEKWQNHAAVCEQIIASLKPGK